MRLVACPSCHTQYDVSDVVEKDFACRCGATVENRPFEGIEAGIYRCAACGAQVGGDDESCVYCGSHIDRDTHALSLICPECFARNAEASRFCTGCGVAFAPEPLPGDLHEYPCPCCGCLMPVRRIGDVGINECPQCNGLWVPENQFDVLVQRALEAHRGMTAGEVRKAPPRVKGGNPASQRVQYRKCPVCEAFMHRRNFRKSSGVIIDRCNDHGTWLDADELEQIAGFILSGGRPASTAALESASLPGSASAGAGATSTALFSSRDRALLDLTGKNEGRGFMGSLANVLSELLD